MKKEKLEARVEELRVCLKSLYAAIERRWPSGDEIELTLLMKPRLVEANPRVEEVRNQVAIMRGPVVYCLESIDLPDDVKIAEVHIPRDIQLTQRHDRKLLGGITVLEGEACPLHRLSNYGVEKETLRLRGVISSS